MAIMASELKQYPVYNRLSKSDMSAVDVGVLNMKGKTKKI
jgi:hypothetical protein